MSEYQSAAGFPTTHWSRVLRAAADPTDREGRDALERLCRDYWYPLYAFARRQGLDREEAGDLVHPRTIPPPLNSTRLRCCRDQRTPQRHRSTSGIDKLIREAMRDFGPDG